MSSAPPDLFDPMQHTAHRPWPLPDGPWAMRQSWHDLLFAHWPLPVDAIRPHIPPPFAVDTYDGSAWISIVPFRMSGIRPRRLPGLPWLSAFPELNVRTYVTAPQAFGLKPGVFFFSLDAANPAAVAIARRVYHLPYYRARMSLQDTPHDIRYASLRTHSNAAPARFEATYAPTGGIQPAQPGTIAHWLAERYCLYTTDSSGRPYRAEIHHAPWPLQPAEAEFAANTVAAAGGVTLPDAAPLLHFARRVDVRVWPLRRLDAPASA